MYTCVPHLHPIPLRNSRSKDVSVTRSEEGFPHSLSPFPTPHSPLLKVPSHIPGVNYEDKIMKWSVDDKKHCLQEFRSQID